MKNSHCNYALNEQVSLGLFYCFNIMISSPSQSLDSSTFCFVADFIAATDIVIHDTQTSAGKRGWGERCWYNLVTYTPIYPMEGGVG